MVAIGAAGFFLLLVVSMALLGVGAWSGSSPSYQQIYFSSQSCSNAVDTYLWPASTVNANNVNAQWLPIRVPSGKTATLSLAVMGVTTAPATQKSTLTVYKRSTQGTGAGAATALTFDIAVGANFGTDDTHIVTVADKDEVAVLCHPTAGQTAGPQGGLEFGMLLTIQ